MKQQQPQQRFRFRAVSIHPAIMGACQAAHACSGQRFLSNEAPLLPLPDCSNVTGCRCKYQHWDDRRGENRRSSDSDTESKQQVAPERRQRKDRRSR